MLLHLSQLGLRVNWEHSKLSPMQRISFLGMELELVLNAFLVNESCLEFGPADSQVTLRLAMCPRFLLPLQGSLDSIAFVLSLYPPVFSPQMGRGTERPPA